MSYKIFYEKPALEEVWTSSLSFCASVGAGIDGVNENDGIWDETTF